MDHFGLDWRSQRDNAMDKAEKERDLGGFMNQLCQKHCLARAGLKETTSNNRKDPAAASLQRVPEQSGISYPPEVELLAEDLEWEHGEQRMKIIVDCLGLCNLMNDDAMYNLQAGRKDCLPLLREAADFLAVLPSQGWRPQLPHVNLIHWRRRGFNALADYLCNKTMDDATSWE